MGSEKYPDENSFDMYCSKHGGYTDANTDYESVSVFHYTCLYMHVHHADFNRINFEQLYLAGVHV